MSSTETTVPDAPLRLDHRADRGAVATERLCLTFDARARSRSTGWLESGIEVTILLPRGSVMRGGDKLRSADGRVIEVVSACEPLFEVSVVDAARAAQAAYHLGNRHVAVEIRDGALRVARDAVLERMLRGLGLEPKCVDGPFEPEGGAYGESHTHGGAAHALAPVIHEYRRS